MTTINDQYLDGQYLDKNPSFHVEDSQWKAAQILKMLAQMGYTPSTVAEVGCGAGEILVQLSKKLPHTAFVGYEMSPQGYELCKTRESKSVKYSNDDLTARVGEPYDLLLCIDVLEHVEDYFSFLRGLKKHGRSFIFHIPLDMNAQMVLRNIPAVVRQTVGHLHYFCKDTALAALQECGYETKSWFYTGAAVDRPTKNGILLQVPRRMFFRLMPNLTAQVLGGYSLMVYAVRNS